MSMTEITPQKKKKRKRLLLVEDNPGDIRLTLEAIKECKIEIEMDVISDGDKVMRFLYKEGEFQNAERPDVIMLDLNLPKRNGIEILHEIKSSPRFKRIPVIAVTTSEADHDIYKAYDTHANAYILKPVDFDDFTRVIQHLEAFWFRTVKLSNE
jgi:chemotaxis family two-component system response regulator Rcp1